MGDFCFHEGFLAEWVARFPEAEVHRFPDAGHYVVEDAADTIRPIVGQFLEQTAPHG
jgi:haloalkane dehalogenase